LGLVMSSLKGLGFLPAATVNRFLARIDSHDP